VVVFHGNIELTIGECPFGAMGVMRSNNSKLIVEGNLRVFRPLGKYGKGSSSRMKAKTLEGWKSM
jgi:hypothetical protein